MNFNWYSETFPSCLPCYWPQYPCPAPKAPTIPISHMQGDKHSSTLTSSNSLTGPSLPRGKPRPSHTHTRRHTLTHTHTHPGSAPSLSHARPSPLSPAPELTHTRGEHTMPARTVLPGRGEEGGLHPFLPGQKAPQLAPPGLPPHRQRPHTQPATRQGTCALVLLVWHPRRR